MCGAARMLYGPPHICACFLFPLFLSFLLAVPPVCARVCACGALIKGTVLALPFSQPPLVCVGVSMSCRCSLVSVCRYHLVGWARAVILRVTLERVRGRSGGVGAGGDILWSGEEIACLKEAQRVLLCRVVCELLFSTFTSLPVKKHARTLDCVSPAVPTTCLLSRMVHPQG